MPALGPTRAHVALVLIVVLWASYPAMAKLAMRDFSPFFIVLARCLVAASFLVVLLARSGGEAIRELPPGALRAFLVLGVAGVWISMQFTYVGIYYTTASNAVILQAATPVTVALGARFYLGERLHGWQWAGVAASAAGVLVVITNGRFTQLVPADMRPGDFITLASLCGWTAYTLYGKRLLGVYSPELATDGGLRAGDAAAHPHRAGDGDGSSRRRGSRRWSAGALCSTRRSSARSPISGGTGRCR